MNTLSRIKEDFGGINRWKWGVPLGLLITGVIIGLFITLIVCGISDALHHITIAQ
jgi:hypothetical protein